MRIPNLEVSMRKVKYISEETRQYMYNTWNCGDAVDDISMLWEADEYECVAKLLVDAGAVVPNCKAAKEMIAVAKNLTDNAFRRRWNKAIKTSSITMMECTSCNHMHYIPGYCDPKDWVSCDGCGVMGCLHIYHPILTKLRRKMGVV